MKYLEQKPGHLWWTRNPRTLLYFVREFSAILILTWILGSLILSFFFPKNSDGIALFFTYLGLIGAIIHSITWLAAMPQILPFRLNKSQQKIAYAFLLMLFLGITLFINYFVFNGLVLLI
jgi:fumarate reductase subunit C